MLKYLIRKLKGRPVLFMLKKKVGGKPEPMSWTNDQEWQYGIMYPDKDYTGGAFIEADGGMSRFSICICAIIIPV